LPIALEGVALRQQGIFPGLGGLGGKSAEGIIGVGDFRAVRGEGNEPVVTVVGIMGNMLCAVDLLQHLGQGIVAVVEIGYAVVTTAAGLPVLYLPFGQIVVIGGGNPGGSF